MLRENKMLSTILLASLSSFAYVSFTMENNTSVHLDMPQPIALTALPNVTRITPQGKKIEEPVVEEVIASPLPVVEEVLDASPLPGAEMLVEWINQRLRATPVRQRGLPTGDALELLQTVNIEQFIYVQDWQCLVIHVCVCGCFIFVAVCALCFVSACTTKAADHAPRIVHVEPLQNTSDVLPCADATRPKRGKA